MSQLKDFITIDKRFQTSINLQLDIENNKKLNSYIPTRSSVTVLEEFLDNVIGNKNKANILIGPYGKGKSHLLLVLMAILSDKDGENTKKVLNKIGKVSLSAKEKINEIREKHQPFLPVIISGTDKDLNQAMIMGLTESLRKHGLKDIAPDSYYSIAIETIHKWKTGYIETYKKLENILRSYEMDVKKLENSLKSMNKTSLTIFKKIYPGLTAGSEFAPIVQSNSMTLYREIAAAIADYGYGGLYIIFDEFSKYIEGHDKDTFAYDMKILQDMCEVANSSKEQQIHITFVAHKSIKEYGNELPVEMINAFAGVEGRLKEIRFVVSAQNNYELIKYAIKKADEKYKELIYDNGENEKIIKASYKIPCFESMFKEKDYYNIVVQGCFPMLPITAYSLLNISEKVAQNERSIFTFLANDERGSIVNIVENGAENLLSVEVVYDYFQSLFKDNVSLTNIHNEWLKAEYALTKAESFHEEKIIKAIAILHMINKNEEIPVKNKEIRLAAGLGQEEFESILQKLKEKEIITYRSKLGIYAFKNNVGINLEKEINDMVQKQPMTLKWSENFAKISELEYVLPKKYNQEYTMTRFFKYVYMLPVQFLKVKNSKYLFETYKADGLIVCLILLKESDIKAVMEQVEKIADKRIIVIYPKAVFKQQRNVRKLMAVDELLNSKSFLEENKVLQQELLLYKEDLIFEINAEFEQIYMLENNKSVCFHCDYKSEELIFADNIKFNRFLSKICLEYYEHAPKINNELINRQNISAQIRKARNQIIETILEEGDFSKYEKGTSSEATIFRATLMHTGIIGNVQEKDEGCRRILNEINKFIKKCAGKKVSFMQLYERLTGKDFGARRGIIPIFIAEKIIRLHGTPIVYLHDKEVDICCDILNNINEKPEEYYLYIEKENIQKEKYLSILEKEFLSKGMNRQQLSKMQRLSNIVEGMQRWYRSIDQYTLTFTKQIFEQEEEGYLDEKTFQKMCSFRKIFKDIELNPREVLFEKIPQAFCEDEKNDDIYNQSTEEIKIIKSYLNNNLENVKRKTAAGIKRAFGTKADESLSACLKNWYQKQSKKAKSHIFTENVTGVMNYIENLNTNDESEIVARMCKIVSGIYINDWKDESYEQFFEELANVVRQVEATKDSSETGYGENKISIQSGDRTIEKYYEPGSDDSTSYFLKNAIEDALEEFGDTLEMNQKVSVLVQALENLFNQ